MTLAFAVIRHAEPEDEADAAWAARASRPWDPPLSCNGRQAAVQAGQQLHGELTTVLGEFGGSAAAENAPCRSPLCIKLVSSPFLRCLQTARAVMDGFIAAQRSFEHGACPDTSAAHPQLPSTQDSEGGLLSSACDPNDGDACTADGGHGSVSWQVHVSVSYGLMEWLGSRALRSTSQSGIGQSLSFPPPQPNNGSKHEIAQHNHGQRFGFKSRPIETAEDAGMWVIDHGRASEEFGRTDVSLEGECLASGSAIQVSSPDRDLGCNHSHCSKWFE